MNHMDREQFFARLAVLDEERLKKVLWNLYWRGTAVARQRIEAELDPESHRQQRAKIEEVDPQWTLREVREFVELARAGAYLGGDRRVAPRERTRWRFTFKQLVKDAGLALRQDDVADGATAMELLVDLAQEMRDYDYFRSEDPIEAAQIVVSDEVAMLWSRVVSQLGFREFAQTAAPQLVRWESRYGWTRTGFGRVREQESSLATVVGRMLTAPDHWVAFADCYLDALDVAAGNDASSRSRRHQPGQSSQQRAGNLAEWHLMLLERLFGGKSEDRLDRLASHRALDGPNLIFFRAMLAQRRGDQSAARRLTTEALERLPGHREFLAFASEVGAPLPARAAEVARARIERLMSDEG